MSTPVLTFFNNKGGVGKTSLIYHLAWMFSQMGKKVVAIDLDPQANLTSAFLDEARLEQLWDPERSTSTADTVYRCIHPLTEVGDILSPEPICINPNLHLIAGDLRLAGFEDQLSQEWAGSLGGGNLYRPFRVLTAFWQVAQMASLHTQADMILADVGPNLGAINRSALIGSDYVVIPLAADLFSLQGLSNLGPTLRKWRIEWNKRLDNWGTPAFPLPKGRMEALGYVVQQHSERLSRPVKVYQRWLDRIPGYYKEHILNGTGEASSLDTDPNRLAMMKHYRSLVPLSLEARKPIFLLSSADGAIGSHAYAAQDAGNDFRRLAGNILNKIELRDLF
jgi:chromosome partitioning protein